MANWRITRPCRNTGLDYNFIVEMWKSINVGEIPSLASLSCNIIYFSLKQKRDETVTCFTGLARTPCVSNCRCEDGVCYGFLPLWRFIQRCLNSPPRLSPGFALTFQQVCEVDLKQLNLPSLILGRYFTFAHKSTSPRDLFSFPHPRGNILWTFPQTKQSERNRKTSFDNVCRRICTGKKYTERSECQSRLDYLECSCLDVWINPYSFSYFRPRPPFMYECEVPEPSEWVDFED